MFDISFWELAIIFVITLLVVGPDKLPELIRDLGRWVRKLRRLITETQYEFEREFNFEEEKKRLKDQSKDFSSAIDELDDLMSIAPDKEPDFKKLESAENQIINSPEETPDNGQQDRTDQKT